MRIAALLVLLAAGIFGVQLVDIVTRLTSANPTAVAFGEGGDDAFYYFTVARNIAAGRGITIDGIHWSSGFQPLWAALTGIAFLLPSDRAAFVLIYVVSLAFWVVSALLVVRFVKRASTAPVDTTAAAMIVLLFLCERQLNALFLNGMESGLNGALMLWLLTAFQAHFAAPFQTRDGKNDKSAVLKLGLICGLAMLARNDNVFLCGFLLLGLLVQRGLAPGLRQAIPIVAIASALVLPWLLYTYWLIGSPIPQSGIATSQALRPNFDPYHTQVAIAEGLVPMLFAKTQQLVRQYERVSAIAGIFLALALAAIVLRPRPSMVGGGLVDRASRACLLALGGFSLVAFAYYTQASSSIQFYERYFAPAKLLVLILLFLVLVQIWHRVAARAVATTALVVIALAAFATSVNQTALNIGLPWKGHFGQVAYEIGQSPYARSCLKIGMMESGRTAFLYPDRVVNLDGKVNVEALAAMRAGTLLDYIRKSNFDVIMLNDYDERYLDQKYPAWRELYGPAGKLANIAVFTRKSGGSC